METDPKKDNWLAVLGKLRQKMILSAAGDPSLPTDKRHRPPWLLRLACLAFDMGTVAILFSALMASLLGGPVSERGLGLALAILLPAYYLFWEWLIGRTPAKVILGLKMLSSTGEITRVKMVWRGIVRFLPVINLVLMLSWRRVTLLDLLSGTRVQIKPIGRKRAKSAGDSPRTGKSATIPHPRGYDENLSQR